MDINDDRAMRTMSFYFYHEGVMMHIGGAQDYVTHALSKIIDNPYLEELESKTTEKGFNMPFDERMYAWKLWWADNAESYGASPEEVAFAKRAISEPEASSISGIANEASQIENTLVEAETEAQTSRKAPWVWLIVGAALLIGILARVSTRSKQSS